MSKETSWIKAIMIGLISSILSLIVFLLYQVFMADILLAVITAEYEAGVYFNSNIILFVGLFLILTLSMVINLFFIRNYSLNTRIIGNLLVFALTLIILFVFAWISIILVYNEQYQALTLEEQFRLIPYFFVIVSIYILPSPIIFWIVGLVIYHILLILFIKFFYMEKKPVYKKYPVKKKKSKIDTNKYSMI